MLDTESLNDALVDCIKATGSSKEYGAMLWPEKPIKDAQNLLLACLNNDRPEKLSPDQAMFIARKAKEKGCHIAINFICTSLGYSIPTPIEPKDEMAELLKKVANLQSELIPLLNKLNVKG